MGCHLSRNGSIRSSAWDGMGKPETHSQSFIWKHPWSEIYVCLGYTVYIPSGYLT
jgi:hypothetical protein